MESKTLSSHYIGQYKVLVDYSHRTEKENMLLFAAAIHVPLVKIYYPESKQMTPKQQTSKWLMMTNDTLFKCNESWYTADTYFKIA